MSDDWADAAACRGKHDLFFFQVDRDDRGEKRGGYTRKEQALAEQAEKAAKAICADCPVRSACRDYALSAREEHGIWAGMNEKERRTLLRRQRTSQGRHRIICDACQGPFNSDKHYQRYCSVSCAVNGRKAAS